MNRYANRWRGLALAPFLLFGIAGAAISDDTIAFESAYATTPPVTDAHPLNLLPVGSSFELKQDVYFVPHQKAACFQSGKSVECTTVQKSYDWQSHCFIWMKETTPTSRRLKAGGPALKITKVSTHGNDVRLAVTSKSVEFLHCVDGKHGSKVPTIAIAKAHFGDWAKLEIAPPVDIDPLVNSLSDDSWDDSSYADSPVTDAHPLRLLPTTSTFELKKPVEFVPHQQSACFVSGKVVECTTVRKYSEWSPHCAITLKDTTTTSRRLKAGGPALKVGKVVYPGVLRTYDVELHVGSKTVSFFYCADGKTGDKSPTIGFAKAQFGDWLKLEIAPPTEVDPR